MKKRSLLLLVIAMLFASCKPEIEKPTAVTKSVEEVTETTAKVVGQVTSDGGAEVTERGVCWNTEGTPEIMDFRTKDGTGVGTYESEIINLNPNTKYYVRAYATNKSGTSYGEEMSFTTLEVLPEEPLVVTTLEVREITSNSAVCGGNVVGGGDAVVLSRGVCWSTNQNPTIEDNKTTDGVGVGDFTSDITNLNPNTQYYVRAYAFNKSGISYGEEVSFTTLEVLPGEPLVVTTLEVREITSNSAVCGGKAVGGGNAVVITRGVCWNTSQNPTVEDYKTIDGVGVGSFTSNIQNLNPNTKYYVRAYATNKSGTSYGKEVSFTTLDKGQEPVVTTSEVSEITVSSAVCGGEVVSGGDAVILVRGICYNTIGNPTVADIYTMDGSNIGAYTAELTQLAHNTTYYVRAYATNANGITAYGEEVSFATLEKLLPVVTTSEVSKITTNSAVCGGEVTFNGNVDVISRGICWSTSQDPTVEDSKTIDGNGLGNFISNITDLVPDTKYYVRAYATNEVGTAYGEQKSFTTITYTPTITVNGVSFTMIAVKGGTFQMGATSEQGYNVASHEKPVHTVTLSDYYIGETEVTQELWTAVMGSNPSYSSDNPQKPVEKVSWDDCHEFIARLNELTGKNFRLPTEAEWEYAARGGALSQGYKYSGGNGANEVAWYDDNAGHRSQKVKVKQANELGVYDMSGNVWEWCQDWYGDYTEDSQTDPTGPESGTERVLRGGAWNFSSLACRVSSRLNRSADLRSYDIGLRLCFSQQYPD